MNHDDPHHRSPPRAEPLQPDRPGQGSAQVDSGKAPEKGQPGDSPESAKKLKEQNDTAHENTREGYGGN